jgi:hypothetical protein
MHVDVEDRLASLGINVDRQAITPFLDPGFDRQEAGGLEHFLKDGHLLRLDLP